jgi:hypothetical protein
MVFLLYVKLTNQALFNCVSSSRCEETPQGDDVSPRNFKNSRRRHGRRYRRGVVQARVLFIKPIKGASGGRRFAHKHFKPVRFFAKPPL